MAQPDIRLNQPQKGLNRASQNLGEADYSTLLNGVFDNTDTGEFILSNEMSNILSSKFKDGFKVINGTNDIYSNTTYFFLVNPETGVGEFGQIKNLQQVQNEEDILNECDECIDRYDFATPLEEIDQIEINQYTTLLTDECHVLDGQPEKGFNFSILHPIKKTVIKNEKCGKTIYFSDDFNPPRYIVLDNITQYQTTGGISCGEDQTEPTCLDIDKLFIFRKFQIPNLTPVSIELGGRLKMGVYQFLIAYTDSAGNEISEYFSITNPIHIFDRNNISVTQAELSNPTNFSIKLNVSDIDQRYGFYKIVVAQTLLESQGTTRYFEEGVHPVNDNTVVYGGENDKRSIEFSEIFRENLYIERSEFMAEANNTLIQAGITVESEINLQPVVNLLGNFVKWQTHIATEDLYVDGVASSLYTGYNRDEVVPLSFSFTLTGGRKTARFPLIAREATTIEMQEVDADNLDRESIELNLSACNTTERTKNWQYYNYAEEEGFCGNEGIPTIEVQQAVTKICYIEDIAESLSGSMTISLEEPYTNLEDYIEDNKEGCPESFQGTDLCDLLDISNYEEETCLEGLFGDNCDSAELVEEEIEVVSIEGQGEDGKELFQGIEKIFPDDYSKIKKPEYCLIYDLDTETGKPYENLKYKYEFLYATEIPLEGRVYGKILQRNYTFVNESCQTADDIQDIQNGNDPIQGYFNNYFGAETIAELQTSKDATCTPTANWTNKIHEGALWFKGYTLNRDSFILEVSSLNDVGNKDDNVTTVWNPDQEIRVSIFNRCNSTTPLFCKVYSPKNQGMQLRIDKVTGGINIYDDSDPALFIAETNVFPNGNFFVAIDNPIYACEGVEEWLEEGDENTEAIVDKYRTVPTDGCYGVATRSIEFSEALITWDKITLRKKSTYLSNCTYNQPIVQSCKAVPYKFGKLAYWESQETYPDNNELYNSSDLLVEQSDIPEEFRTDFEQAFVQAVTEDRYILKENTDYRCRPIRHFKMPDNKVSPFMYENEQAPFSNSIIYPLGFTINEEIINVFLDLAVKNNLISAEKRSQITGYEIYRGDITQDRSILSSGLLYDMRSYEQKDGTETFYSSYPYNDLGDDKLNYNLDRTEFLQHPFDGEENNKFTFHSPETDYYRPTLPSEISVQGYMFGQSKGHFDQVKDHPKWVILTSKAKNLAGLLAGIETATEIAVNIAQSSEAWRFQIGLSNSANPVGIGFNIAVGALSAISGVVANFGRYRLEWLRAFRDLGQPENFASYYYSEGKYNYFLPLQENEDKVRGINTARYLKEGDAVFTNDVTGERVNINHLDREKTVFLSLGETNLRYPQTYINYDNNNIDFNTASLTFASENGLCQEGLSEEVNRNIASPYVALKNYLPSQYNTINSIKWVSTGYRGDLRSPSSQCLSVFGGDTYISRHTFKRKIPLFSTTAFGEASLTPFNYKFYNNIGRQPRFYADYEVVTDFSKNSAIFPDIDYELRFDCTTRRQNYYRPPSKFYLYYYGVPSFLTETRINTNLRTAGDTPEKNFYPNVGDLNFFTQQRNVPIRTPNYFFYNDTYSRTPLTTTGRVLQATFEQVLVDCQNNKPNGIIWSGKDNSENNTFDQWLIYKPLDYFEFPTEYGKLKDIRTIEREQILVRFENTTAIFDSVDMTVDDGQNPQTRNLASSFARRAVTFSETELGYGGTQSSQSVSCEFGHFHVDVKRGQVMQIGAGGKSMEEISSFIGGKPSGMRSWFKEHLPFKILKSSIVNAEKIDTDNAYNGVGITMGYDSRLRRVFITKKDYIPVTNCIEYIEGQGFVNNLTVCEEVPQTITCPEGYTYDEESNLCVLDFSYSACPIGYTYNPSNQLCEINAENCLSDIIFVMDNSGSVSVDENNQLNDFVKDIIIGLQDSILSDSVRVSIVKFGTIAELKQGLTNDLSLINAGIDSTRLTGSTNVNGGLCLASLELTANSRPEATKQIILIADGINNTTAMNSCMITPSIQGGITFGKTLKDAGVKITVVALGLPFEREGVLNTYGGTSISSPYMDYPLASIGSGLSGYASYEASFEDAQNIVDDIVNAIACVEQVEPFCLTGCEEDNGICNCEDTTAPILQDVTVPIELTDTNYFKDVSWTIAYSPIEQKWVGWYSYKPNYYIAHQNYFQTGVNQTNDESEFGLWSHLLTNKSYQVFYGKRYPFIVEYMLRREYGEILLKAVGFEMDVQRYHNEYDIAEIPQKTFNKMWVYSPLTNSGELRLVPNTGQISFISKYPKTAQDKTYQEVLASYSHNSWSVNYLYNRVIKPGLNNPQWAWDENQIDKTLNTNLVTFGGKNVLENMRSKVMTVRLQQDQDSLFKFNFHMFASKINKIQ